MIGPPGCFSTIVTGDIIAMTDSPTVKAVVSTLLTLAILFCIGVVGHAIGQNSSTVPTSEEDSYVQADEAGDVTPHNYPAASGSLEEESSDRQ